MTPKCEQDWPEKDDRKKTFGHMDVMWRDETPIRAEFTHNKFEIINQKEGKTFEIVFTNFPETIFIF